MQSTNHIPDNHARIPNSSGEWFQWLSQEEKKTRNAYLAKPATLVAEYHREHATVRDYEGREILELLQNAADQARQASVSGKVIIELQPEGLIVANTGTPFSVGGVTSLQTSNLSSKRHSREQYIGNKGLGFRSVLNWSDSPIILSGNLALMFEPNYARQIVKDLCDKSTELAELVTKEKGGQNSIPAPVLPFPKFSNTSEIEGLIKDSSAQKILSKCKQWRNADYTTVIGMPFRRSQTYQVALRQIERLPPEILLFVKYLDEIRFVSCEREDILWQIKGDDTSRLVKKNSQPLGTWQVYRTTGPIPTEELDHHQHEPLDYQLIVALPEQEESVESYSSPLFSHFPTDIVLPLPVVCHATLELTQNRKHAQQIKSNTYVFKRLANFLAEIAEARAKVSPVGTRAGFRILMNHSDYSPELEYFCFEQELFEAASQRSIVPTLGGTAVRPDDAIIIPGADDTWLPAEVFSNVVPIDTNSESSFFDKLQIKALSSVGLKKQLSNLPALSDSRRAALISGLLKHNIDKAAHTSTLFIDTKGQLIPDDSPVFLAPKGSSIPELPEWAELRFLNENLRKKLAQSLEVKDSRELQVKLSTFGLLEYSLANLVSRLVSAANNEKKKGKRPRHLIEQDLINTLFSLYQSEGSSSKRPEFPEKVTVSLPNQENMSSAANILLLGKGYGEQGNIVQALHEGWAREYLIAPPNRLGLTANTTEITEFLKWLRVADWPRKVKISNPDEGFLSYIQDCLPYPVRFEEYEFNSREDIERIFIDKVCSISGLENILSHADSSAILAWLGKDPQAYSIRSYSHDHARLSALTGYDRTPRLYSGSLPSYVRWKIESTAWLKNQHDVPIRPNECILGERAIESIFQRPVKPSSHSMTMYNVTNQEIIEGLRNSGVATSLEDLNLEDIYKRLLELPDNQPEGEYAPNLYRWLLDASDRIWPNNNRNTFRERFHKEGCMWGNHGDISGYFPISELRHADTEGLPKELLDRLKIVALPHRVGPGKVRKLFGIQSIDRNDFSQVITNFQPSIDLDSEFQKAKPYFFLLRSSQTKRIHDLEILKEMRLKVCFKINAEMTYENEKFKFRLPAWGWLIDHKENLLYIQSDPAEPLNPASHLLADSIGEAIAAMFRIADGGQYARIFSCRDEDRKILLQRMRGETADEDMDKIIEKFSLQSQALQLPMFPENQSIPNPSQVNEPAKPAEEAEILEITTGQVSEDISKEFEITKPPKIKSVPHQPKSPPRLRNLQIKAVSSGTRTISKTTTRITDGDFSERKAFEFEENTNPPRFPLRVGQLTGTSAFGCDILSFNSERDRENFRTGENRDLSKVSRFIEVKGRKHEQGTIELKGNELRAAITYSKRYYLYRIHETTPGAFALNILQDPRNQNEALDSSIHVNLNIAKNTKQYEITGGVQQTVYNNENLIKEKPL